MSRHKPYENNNKFLITERSLNYILRPVQVRSQNYPYTYSIENLDETVSVTVDRAWTPYNHLVLDFIGHALFTKAYKNVVKDRNSWKNEGRTVAEVFRKREYYKKRDKAFDTEI